MPPGVRFVISRVFPAACLLFGVGISAYGLWHLKQAGQSRSWPTAQGLVRHASVELSAANSAVDTDVGPVHHAAISYEFRVNGTLHTGNRVSFGDFSASDPSHARSVVNRYGVGTKVSVHYRPGDPDDCVLEPGVSPGAWIMPGVGFGLLLMGALTAIQIPRWFREEDEAARLGAPAEVEVTGR